MKATLQVNNRLSVEIDASGQKDLFEELASLQEIFGVTKCGKCGGEDLKFVVRENDGNKFYELHCQKSGCFARLAFGSHKKGDTLFPKRKDSDGQYLPDGGWTRWDKEKGERV